MQLPLTVGFLLAFTSVHGRPDGTTVGPIVIYRNVNPHIPLSLKSSLNLTPSDLKVFSGHALAMFHSKCPQVAQDKLFSIQKFIGKVLAESVDRTKGKKSDSPDFLALIDSLQTCNKVLVHPPQESTEPTSDLEFPSDHQVVDVKMEADEVVLTTFVPQDKPVTEGSKMAHVSLSKSDADVKSTNKPPVLGHPKPQSKTANSDLHSWLSNIMSEIRGFFSSAKTENQHPSGRKTRSADKPDLDFMETVLSSNPNKDQDSTLTEEEEAMQQVVVLDESEMLSKEAARAQKFVGEICRVFCAHCNLRQMKYLRMAARELLDFLIVDENRAAAFAHLANDELLESLGKCENPAETMSAFRSLFFPLISFFR